MIEVLINRVLIKPDPVEKMSAGGIIMQLDERREKAETTTGIIMDIGPAAWLDPIMGGVPACEIGDHVVYSKYSGKFVTDPEDGEEYVVINDDGIQARLRA